MKGNYNMPFTQYPDFCMSHNQSLRVPTALFPLPDKRVHKQTLKVRNPSFAEGGDHAMDNVLTT